MFGVTSKYLAVAVAGGACVALAACSSSSSATAGSTASLPAISTSGAASAASSVASAVAGKLSSADCAVLKDISGSAVTTLTPLQADPSKASSLLKTYEAQLKKDEGKVTSAAAKSQIEAWIAALNKSQTESTADATSTITSALGNIAKGCV